MLKMVVRGLALVAAVFVAVASVAMIQEDESLFPAGTSHSFLLSVAQSDESKTDLVHGLDQVADGAGVTLVKIASSPDGPANEKDLVWFGSMPPGDFSWFDASLTGQVTRSGELGDRPLDGAYAMSGGAGDVGRLVAWAQANGVTVDGVETRSLQRLGAAFFTATGPGFAVVCVTVLLVSVVMTWLLVKARSRSLRLLGGVAPWRIHAWDVWFVARSVAVWSAVGWALSGAVVWGQRGTGRMVTFAGWSAAGVGIIDAVVVAGCAVVSWLSRPRAADIAARRPPVGPFRRAGVVVRMVAVVMAVTALPFSVAFTQGARDAQKEAARWADARGVVTTKISYAGTEDGTYRPGVLRLADKADQAGIGALSYTIDKAIELTPEELGPFDHVVLTDPVFLSLMKIDRRDLVPLGDAGVPPALRQFLNDQLPLWTRDSGLPSGTSYFTYRGNHAFPAVGNGIGGGAAVAATNPLVIVVDHPLAVFNAGFVIATMSSGNLLFTDAEQLRALLHAEGVEPVVNSIDNVADVTLDAAQVYAQQARFGAMATVMALLALLVALVQAAQIWAGTNQRKIFALRTAGRSYWSIQRGRMAFETVFVVAACTAAALGARSLSGGVQAVVIVAVIVPAYLVATVIVHRAAAAASFSLSLRRQTT